MKNEKLMAVLKLVLTLIIGAVLGHFVVTNSVIDFSSKKATTEDVANAENTDDTENVENKEETVDANVVETEKTDDTKEFTEESSSTDEENEDEASEDEENNDENKEDEKEEKKKEIKNPFSYENIDLGLDLAGGVSVVYEAATDTAPTKEEMKSAIALLRTRLTYKGHTEAEVSQQGDKKIRVEMPGVTDPTEAVKEIGQTAEITFYGLKKEGINPYPTTDANGTVKYLILKQAEGQEEGTMNVYNGETIGEIAEMLVPGKNIKDAYKNYTKTSEIGGLEPSVSLEFDTEGTRLFAEGTEKYLNNYIVIALDQDIISVATVNDVLPNGQASISGSMQDKEAESLANLIKSGSLPFKLEAVETSIIGARLGQDALSSSIKAGIIGIILVAIFMIIVYVFPGIIATISLSLYMVLLMCVLSYFKVTLTLPGIAGIILSVGMAVDANVIIFTRIKEELVLGKTINSAITSGFQKGKSAIVDGNITTLIIAAILYWLGIGAIRGFAQTLALGIILSMFTALVITKFLLNIFVTLGVKKPALYGARKIVEPVTVTELNKKHGRKK